MRVDTRGAGQSAGWGTIGARPEIMDVSAAAQWLHDELGARSVHLVGYSTGAAVCSSVLDQFDFVRGLVVRATRRAAAAALPYGCKEGPPG
jgi:alpha/beta superfamily hydrolase